MFTTDQLVDACTAWQGGRDGGSSPIRAGARLLTNTQHYFQAPYIAQLERKAQGDEVTKQRARTLLHALGAAPRRDASGWSAAIDFSSDWAGRGVESKVAHSEDQQILGSLRTGMITMPLWGVSLDRSVAESFGSRFTFELVGGFPAVPAWIHSGIKGEERELIVGGAYRVESMRSVDEGDRTIVRLRFIVPVSSQGS